MNTLTPQTPLQRLAETRLAIERQMSADKPATRSDSSEASQGRARPATPALTQVVWLAAQSWWRKQPASLAVDLAEPVLGIYARKYPLVLVTVAAGLGAVTTLSRPWRLLSGKRLMWLAASSAGVPALLQSWAAQRKAGADHAR